jgi:hypothetical protein
LLITAALAARICHAPDRRRLLRAGLYCRNSWEAKVDDTKTRGVIAWMLEYKKWCEVQPDRLEVWSPLTKKVGQRQTGCTLLH